MLQYDPLQCLPSSAELPDSDETPVDNELQQLVPELLKLMLVWLWRERMDWFFGIDMAVYYDPDEPAIVSDGFISIGVPRIVDEELRLSYALWEENDQVPVWVLEVVSKTYRGEYSQKQRLYARMGVLYYTIYSNRRRRRPRLEVYRLVKGEYVLQLGNLVWMPELGLGLGCERGRYQEIEREWLYWYDQTGCRYPTLEERAQRAEQSDQRAEQAERRAEQERQRAEELAQRLRDLGLEP